MSVIGLFLVFFTFVAKDIIRDRLKDRIEAIESAQNIYLIRADSTESLAPSAQFFTFSFSSEEMQYRNYKQLEKVIDDEYNKRWNLVLPQVQDFDKTIDNLSRLDAAIPSNSPKNVKELNQLKSNFDGFSKVFWVEAQELKTKVGNLSFTAGAPGKDKDQRIRAYHEALERLDEASRSLPLRMLNLQLDTNKLGKSECDAAEDAKKRLDREYLLSIWFCSMLFIAGWGLNMMAVWQDDGRKTNEHEEPFNLE